MSNSNMIYRLVPFLVQGWSLFEEDDEENKTVEKIWDFAEDVVPRFDSKQFKMHFRLESTTFEDLLQKLHAVLPYTNNAIKRGHPVIPLDKQTMLTLWCLANIESFRSVSQRFGVSKSTAWDVLYRVCDALLKVNKQFKIIAWPSAERAEHIINGNKRINGFPGVLGSIDGSHIRIMAPKEHPNSYYNRKKYHSVLLQGVCDHLKLFTDVYVGEPGSVHDARLYSKSPLKEDLDANVITFPHDSHLLGDLAYPLQTTLLVGFKNIGNLTCRQKNYNVKLSQVRVKIENAFALLKGRFRRLKYMETRRLDLICLLVTAASVLHNICILNGDSADDIMNIEEERLVERQNNVLVAYEGQEDGRVLHAIQKRNNIINSLRL